MGKSITYVTSDYGDFLQYQKDNPEEVCEYIVDVTTLNGRTPGNIVELESSKTLWNIIGILESIDRFKLKHKDFFEKEDAEGDIEELGLSEDDMKLGVN